MAIRAKYLSRVLQSDVEVKNPHSPMSIPLNIKCADQDENLDFELVSASSTRDPESEGSPRDGIPAGAQDGKTNSFRNEAATASFASTVTDFDYPHYHAERSFESGMAFREPSGTASFGSNRGGCIASFTSTATDFDEFTSPGAQAQRNHEYCEAVYGIRNGMNPCPQAATGFPMPDAFTTGCWAGIPATAAVRSHPQFGYNGLAYQGGTLHGGNADSLQAKAAEMECAASQLMAAAMQAKAAAAQMHAQGAAAPQAKGGAEIWQPTAHSGISRGLDLPRSAMSTRIAGSSRTTVMLRNLPNDYTREMVLDLLDSHGFAGRYDFVYLPIDFKRKAGLGYAFVNMVECLDAEKVFAILHGFSRWQFSSSKVLEVAWGNPLQGLPAHIDRYRNSPVMHENVHDTFRPMLFQNGARIQFPAPTKMLQKPRMR